MMCTACAEVPFWQQRLRGREPILNAGNVSLPLIVVGLFFIPAGVAIFFSSNMLQEYQFDYTQCKRVNSNQTCASIIERDPRQSCVCLELIQLPEDFKEVVHIYYGLTRYYQNFRLYVQSRDDKQLLGEPRRSRSQCEPVARDARTGYVYYPCGAIANSLFNDSLRLKYLAGPSNFKDMGLLFDDISWPTDRTRKFKNPP
ncbi:cell cycle control protein 50A-like, partial [Ixodes scapularis]